MDLFAAITINNFHKCKKNVNFIFQSIEFTLDVSINITSILF